MADGRIEGRGRTRKATLRASEGFEINKPFIKKGTVWSFGAPNTNCLLFLCFWVTNQSLKMTKEHCEWSLVARLHATRKDGLVGKVVTNTLPSGDECPGIFAFPSLPRPFTSSPTAARRPPCSFSSFSFLLFESRRRVMPFGPIHR